MCDVIYVVKFRIRLTLSASLPSCPVLSMDSSYWKPAAQLSHPEENDTFKIFNNREQNEPYLFDMLAI